jgi:hypothetical protein
LDLAKLEIVLVELVMAAGIGYWCMTVFRSKGRSSASGFALGFFLTLFFFVIGMVIAVVISYTRSDRSGALPLGKLPKL